MEILNIGQDVSLQEARNSYAGTQVSLIDDRIRKLESALQEARARRARWARWANMIKGTNQ